jgi:hypothetical protein
MDEEEAVEMSDLLGKSIKTSAALDNDGFEVSLPDQHSIENEVNQEQGRKLHQE